MDLDGLVEGLKVISRNIFKFQAVTFRSPDFWTLCETDFLAQSTGQPERTWAFGLADITRQP